MELVGSVVRVRDIMTRHGKPAPDTRAEVRTKRDGESAVIDPDRDSISCSTFDADFAEAYRFLVYEAELLDDNRLDEWVGLLSPSLRYVMPIRLTMPRAELDKSVNHRYRHFDDTYETIKYRVRRVQLPSAHSEYTPSRTRRFVTNVRVKPHDSPDTLDVRSYLLVMRNRMREPTYETISAARNDVLCRTAGSLRLRSREIIIDQATLGVVNLAIFL